ncbi:HAD family hydrolase [Streptacidiphilus sp. ASG 303]|uniref:HAD family hydrolase n=1 Tax=Streptacidiphilus sp. ASG 303 TaxID=2896847 RepID=UPI001E42B791|nr:HAD family hydrolase [Streptacidiphilus sp. ASG 303]MCD0484908.1 HAD family hydrolase [Streptacidiphilus sp. ASG 303]
MALAGVLWDVDDTLFDHSGAERAGILRHLEAEGLPADGRALGLWHAVAEEVHARFTAGGLTFHEHRRERARRFLGDPDLPDDRADAWFAGYVRRYEESWAAFPDVLPALDALGGYRHGVLSNASLARQERKLIRLGMRDRFSCLLCSDRLGTAKPDPRAFRAACDALGLPPQRVAYVGDRLDLDALGARDAGLHGVWLDRAGTGGDPPPGVHRVRTLADLPGLLRRVTG